jgi:hypothetical protein
MLPRLRGQLQEQEAALKGREVRPTSLMTPLSTACCNS